MSVFLAGLFLFLGLTSLAVAGGFITHAASDISNIPNYKNDQDLLNAYSKSIWASVITWITVAAILILIIVYIVRRNDKGTFDLVIIYLFFFISLIMVLIVSILSIITAADINKSSAKEITSAHIQATWAAVLGSLTFVALIIGLVFVIYTKLKKPVKQIKDRQKLNLPVESQENEKNDFEPVYEIQNENPKEIINEMDENNNLPIGEEIVAPIKTKSGRTFNYLQRERDNAKYHYKRIGKQFGVELPDWLFDLGEKAVLNYMKSN